MRDLNRCSLTIPRVPRDLPANGGLAEAQSQKDEEVYAYANANDNRNDNRNGNGNGNCNSDEGGKSRGGKLAREEPGDKILPVKTADEKSRDGISPVKAQSGMISQPFLRSDPVEYKNGKRSITSLSTPTPKAVISYVELTKSGNGGRRKIEKCVPGAGLIVRTTSPFGDAGQPVT